MLTRSPVPATSPNVSPSSFHYAPASSQRRSPKPPTAIIPRRQSSTSSPLALINNKTPQPLPSTKQPPVDTSSSSSSSSSSSPNNANTNATNTINTTTASTTASAYSTTPATYVAVDAATQYSPMEPHNYFATPNPAPTALSQPAATFSSSLNTTTAQSQPNVPISSDSQIHATLSGDPHDPAAAIASPEAGEEPPMIKAPHPLSPNKRRNSQGPGSLVEGLGAGGSSQALPKRPRPDAPPQKVLPLRYELCAIEDIVVLIANMLSELIETNDALAMRSGHLTRFHSRTAPGISVLDYLHRLAKHATLTPPLLLSMVYYIDRLCALYPDFTINTLTVHRFLITSATVAAKGLSDSFWNNSTYARVGGVRVAELKMLELEFLHRVDWKIVPDPDVLVAYYRGLVQRSPTYVLEDEVGEEDGDDDTEISYDNDGDGDGDEDTAEDTTQSEASTRDKPPDTITQV